MRRGIFGGSFDPIHYGHLILANTACKELNLDVIEFVPSYQPPEWYKSELTHYVHRVEMINLALEWEFNKQMDMIEIERKQTSYTIDTIKYFKQKYKKDKLFLITGPDTIYNINKWKDINKIRKLVEVKIALQDFYCPNINIRSTVIKWLHQNNKSIKYLVPKKVHNYIWANNLYKEKTCIKTNIKKKQKK